MNWSLWLRQIHRWVSVIFTGVVVIIFSILGAGRDPAFWVYLLPLLPLGLLALTGLYMFVLPYVERRRGGRRGDVNGRTQ